jgi:uncharacterized cofD-like protein
MPTSDPSVVVIGGGHGCSRSLAALRRLDVRRTAVVTVADDGGSSGRLRRDHDVVALGDLRMALLALAVDAPAGDARATVAALAERRFERGELAGHSLGNLILLGLLEEHDGDLVAAVDALGTLLGAVGRVLPVTLVPVTLSAETATGAVTGQVAVATARRIERVHLEPAAPPLTPTVAEHIAEADIVLLGPGSLYTSVLPVLLVPGLAEVLATTRAKVVLVGNLREQTGETEGMSLADHAEALLQHVPSLRIDVVLAHEPSETRPSGVERVAPLRIDESRLRRSVGDVLRHDHGDQRDGHAPERLASVVSELLVPRRADGPSRGRG